MHNYILETDRLILRPLIVEDAEAVFAWVGDEDVARYMVYNTYESVEQVKGWLEYLKQEDEEYHFGFVRKEDNLLIGAGSIGPTVNTETNEKRDGFWGFGYNLRKDCWGKGYATEAAKAMIKFAHEKFGINHFTCSHAVENKASGRVIEKCGLHFVKYGEYTKLDGTCKRRSMEYEGDYMDCVIEERIKKIGEKEIPESMIVSKEKINEIAPLIVQLWEKTIEEAKEILTEYFDAEEKEVFAHEVDGKAVGLALCSLRHDYVEGCDNSPVGYLEGIVVDKQFQKNGIARILCKECEQWAKSKGCTEFASDCELDNTESLKFHLGIGFEEENRIICFKKMI